MRTQEERLALLHRRAGELKRKRDKMILTVTGSLSAFFLIVLAVVTWTMAGMTHHTINGNYTGASLLGESTGGYVLVAVASFTAAVAITVVCIRWKRRKEDMELPEASSKEQKQS